MDKADMREWICSLETVIDNKLKKWRKGLKVENGEAVQLHWQWEQTHLQINIFWEHSKETVKLKYASPRGDFGFFWHGLNDKTFNKVMDRVGNLAQVTMYPPQDTMDG